MTDSEVTGTGDPMAGTLGGVMRRAARDASERTFLRCGSEETTFAEIDRSSDLVAAGLLRRGFCPGDRLAIAAPNGAEWVITAFAAAKIGVTLVTLNVRYRESELAYMLNDSGARGIVCASRDSDVQFPDLFDRLAPAIPEVHDYFFLGTPSWESLATGPPDPGHLARATASVTPRDPAVILYTSGTTGRPKGAVLTHASILAAADAQVSHFGLTHHDVVLGSLPLNHVGGITCTVVAALIARSKVSLMSTFSAHQALAEIESVRATVFGGVPTMYVLMLADPDFATHDLSCLRYAITGGSNVDPALCAKIRAGFPNAWIGNLYGLSETSGACVISPLDDSEEMVAHSIGKVIDGFEARVVDPEGHPGSTGEVGELQIRGACVASGYWRKPEQTASTFLAQGWLDTGDLALLEPDGHLVLKGRHKEMYIQGGYNVYPVEVENVLTAHPGVALAAGIGVTDPVLGEVGRFYIVPAPGAELSAEELIDWCSARLADYKVPRQFAFETELPLTPAGKVQKSVLQERAAAHNCDATPRRP